MERPMPRPAPVTSAAWPVRSSSDATRGVSLTCGVSIAGAIIAVSAGVAIAGLVLAVSGRRQEVRMPEKETLERAAEDRRQGKAPSTQAGEFVREEMDHIREGKHGARSTKQAIAIGLSKARR